MDANDILGLPKTPLSITQEKKSRLPKEPQRKPDGISPKVNALSGGLAPLMSSIDVSQLKRRPPSDEKVAWQRLPFSNSARKDNLKLYHWVRVINGVPPAGDYSFAEYNKYVDITKHTDEGYEKYLTDLDPYNAAHDTEHKRTLSMALSQTKQQERKDAEVLAEAKRIIEACMAAH